MQEVFMGIGRRIIQFAKENRKYIPFMIMPAVICWIELIFRTSTSGFIMVRYCVYTTLFSIAYGCIVQFLFTLIPNDKIYHAVQAIALFVLVIPYAVVFFSFCEFHVFYDLKTTFGGAGDAVTDFSGDIKKLLISVNGFVHLFLFLLPFILYTVLFRKYDDANRNKLTAKLFYLGTGIIIYTITVLTIVFNKVDWNTYKEQYNFGNAIINFGAATGIRLDIRHMLTDKEEKLSFAFEDDTGEVGTDSTQAAAEPTSTSAAMGDEGETKESQGSQAEQEPAGNEQENAAESEAQEPTEPVVYTPNVLDIDFNELARNAEGELAELDRYVASVTPTMKNEYTGMFEGKNLILITAEALTAEAIDPELTPTLYRMATKGIQFTDYYQPASCGTTGGEYGVIMGMLPTAGGVSMKETADNYNYMTMGNLLNELGYYGKAFHNHTYTYYDRDQTHTNLGYSDGYMAHGNGMEEYLSDLYPKSDVEMLMGTLPTYIDKQPFNIYYMSVSGHSLYDVNVNAMAQKHWDEVKDMEGVSDTVKAYYAGQIEFDRAMEYLVNTLEEKGIADDTVICISSDHFPYGLDNGSGDASLPYLAELYGHEITNNLYRDHNRLIIWSGCLEDKEPIIVEQPVFPPDIMPTLCNLFGIDYDSRLLIGRDVFSDALPLVFNLGYDWKTDLGTYIAATGVFTPVNEEVVIPEGYVNTIKNIIRNKVVYSRGVLQYDYYRHVFQKNVED